MKTHFDKKLILQPFSDIHNYDRSYIPPITDADIIVCAGDMDIGYNISDWVKRVEDIHQKPMICGLGNHDFWNTSTANLTVSEWVEHYRSCNTDLTQFMYNETKIIGNYAIIVATMWTDFQGENPICIRDSKLAKDFTRIRVNDESNITAQQMLLLYKEARDYIVQELEKHKDKKCIVVTHYPPTISCNISFTITPVSYYWVGFMEDIIEKYQPAAWISGHMHNTFIKKFGNTQFVMNPAGKVKNGVIQNPDFIDGLTCQI